MSNLRIKVIVFCVLGLTLISSIYVAFLINTDAGSINVKTVIIPDRSINLSGFVYSPQTLDNHSPIPAVVIAHGIANSKDVVSGLALELAKQGILALAIDEIGHGQSGGTLSLTNNSDPTLGVQAAINYLRTLPYVNQAKLGLIGHSLGAGAVRAADVLNPNIAASVFIGGGLGSLVGNGPTYGTLTTTFPKNLLIIIGQYDVLFNINSLESSDLLPVFKTTVKVQENYLYGSFSTGTARKFITPATAHLFEPLDPEAVSTTVQWMTNSLEGNTNNLLNINLTYQYKEIAILIGVIAFIGLGLATTSIIIEIPYFKTKIPNEKINYKGYFKDWKMLAGYSLLGLILYLPLLGAGLVLSFPPMIFGSSIAWWLVGIGIIAYGGLVLLGPRTTGTKIDTKSLIKEQFWYHEVILALGTFSFLYILLSLLERASSLNLRIVVPIFRELVLFPRIVMFVLFIPFFIIYFFVEGTYFHLFRKDPTKEKNFRLQILDCLQLILLKILPYAFILGIHYFFMIILNIRIFPGYIGFIIEFFWVIIPLFIFSTIFSWYYYQITNTIGTGVILNTLLFAWVAAGLFPLS